MIRTLPRLRIANISIIITTARLSNKYFRKSSIHPFVVSTVLNSNYRNMSSSGKKVVVSTKKAPAALSVYNQAIVSNGMVYCSGQLGANPETGELLTGSIEERTEQIIKNIAKVLEEAGSKIENVVKVTVFITDMANFSKVNSVYEKHWGDVKPARSCVAVHQLPKGTDVEIECVAHL